MGEEQRWETGRPVKGVWRMSCGEGMTERGKKKCVTVMTTSSGREEGSSSRLAKSM